MAPMLAPECDALLKVLSHGEWRSYEDTVQEVALMIAPGRALRKTEERLAAQARTQGPRVSPEPSDEAKIRQGRRSLSVGAMNSMRKRYVEFKLDDKGQRTEVRRRPEPAPVAKRGERALARADRRREQEEAALREREADAALIAARNLDELFPEPPGAAVEVPPAPVEEVKTSAVTIELIRALLRDEVNQALTKVFPGPPVSVQDLDAFQAGMQRFVLERFAALEEILQATIPKPKDRGAQHWS